MASAYPGGLDNFPTTRADGTATPTNHPTDHNDANDALNKIEAELGVAPSGAAATVAARFTALDAAVAAASVPPFLMYPFARVAGETPHAADDFFAAYSGYTEQNHAASVVWALGRGGLRVAWNSIPANSVAVAVKAIPAAGVPITIETAFSATISQTSNPGIGLCFTNGTATTSDVTGIELIYVSGFFFYKLDGVLNNYGATQLSPFPGSLFPLIFLRLAWTAANTFTWSMSIDGDLWTDWANPTIANTMTPTHMGFAVSSNAGTTPHTALFHYLRVYEADLSV